MIRFHLDCVPGLHASLISVVASPRDIPSAGVKVSNTPQWTEGELYEGSGKCWYSVEGVAEAVEAVVVGAVGPVSNVEIEVVVSARGDVYAQTFGIAAVASGT